jgi:hypothetical protein
MIRIGISSTIGESLALAMEAIGRRYSRHTEHAGSPDIAIERIADRAYGLDSCLPSLDVVVHRRAGHSHASSQLVLSNLDAYWVNNAVSQALIDKNVAYGYIRALGLRVPATAALPYPPTKDRERDAMHQAEHIGFPAYLKPQAGFGSIGVVRVESMTELLEAYRNCSGPVNLQLAIPYTKYVRAIGVGPEVVLTHYNHYAPPAERYRFSAEEPLRRDFLSPPEAEEARDLTRIVNAYFDWDFNSCEIAFARDGAYCIDFTQPYPDARPTRLHYYFPEVVRALIRWVVFCATTKRRRSVDFRTSWPSFARAAARFRERDSVHPGLVRALGQHANEMFQSDTYAAWSTHRLVGITEQILAYFRSDEFSDLLRQEVIREFGPGSEGEAHLRQYAALHAEWLSDRDRPEAV